MEQTPKGFKKPTTGDANDLYTFVGDNMDTLEDELDKKADNGHTHQYGNRFEWRYNSETDSLDLVVLT